MLTSSKTDDKIYIKKCSCFQWRQLVPIIKAIFPEISSKDISWLLITYKKTTHVALQYDNIIGFYIYINDKTSDIVWLNYIGVKKENRGCGIGSILLKSFIKTVEQECNKEIKLAAVKDNIAALKLYEKQGFRKVYEGDKKFVYSQKTYKVSNKTRNLKRGRNSSYNSVSKIYLKFIYFIIVDLF